MSSQKQQLAKNLCFGCIAGIYSGIVLFAIVVSLFFQFSFNGITALKGYAIAMAVGGISGLILTYGFYKIQGKQDDKH